VKRLEVSLCDYVFLVTYLPILYVAIVYVVNQLFGMLRSATVLFGMVLDWV
jgi:hypothetical protein